MKLIQKTILCLICMVLANCGKVGPLTLPEDKLDKSVITYPCDEECMERFEEEKKRQESVVLETE